MINIINNAATGDLQPTHTDGESARFEESLDHQRKEKEEEEGATLLCWWQPSKLDPEWLNVGDRRYIFGGL